MAQEEEVPGVRILPPPRRPVLPAEESYVPPVREKAERPVGARKVGPGHTIAVATDIYALLLHEKHALEVQERRLVSFGDVIAALIQDRQRLNELEAKIAAKRAAREAARKEEGE